MKSPRSVIDLSFAVACLLIALAGNLLMLIDTTGMAVCRFIGLFGTDYRYIGSFFVLLLTGGINALKMAAYLIMADLVVYHSHERELKFVSKTFAISGMFIAFCLSIDSISLINKAFFDVDLSDLIIAIPLIVIELGIIIPITLALIWAILPGKIFDNALRAFAFDANKNFSSKTFNKFYQ